MIRMRIRYEALDDDNELCVLGCDSFLHGRCFGDENKGLGKSKGDHHEGFRVEYGIRLCDDEDVIEKYIDSEDMKEYDDDVDMLKDQMFGICIMIIYVNMLMLWVHG